MTKLIFKQCSFKHKETVKANIKDSGKIFQTFFEHLVICTAIHFNSQNNNKQ